MKIFKFEKNDVTKFIQYELNTFHKLKEPLNYVIKSLIRLGNSLEIQSLSKKINLNKIKEYKGKNYHWSTFNYQNATLLIRRYNEHLTIFTKVIKERNTEYGAFTLNTDFSKFDDNEQDEIRDKYYDKPFTGLNLIIKDLFELLINENHGVNWVWNSLSLKRPEHINIELAFSDTNINSLDNFVFCMEELSNIYLTLFAENTMVQKLKEFKVNDDLNEQYKINEISTEIKNDYYHSAGLELIDVKNGNKKFENVYSLTRWFFDDVFKDKIYIYAGEIYVQGDTFNVGDVVAYKNTDDDNDTLIFKSTYPKEKFIPLKLYS